MRNTEIHLGGTARSKKDVLSLSSLGFNFAEIPITKPEKFLSQKSKYLSLKDELGFYYLCHGPREGDPNNTDSLENVYFPKLKKIMSIMPELDMRLLTIHLWFDTRYVKKKVIEYKINLLKRVIERASEKGIMICLENLSEKADDLAGPLTALPLLMLTLDLGHAQLLTSENRSYSIIETFPKRIGHIHLHDNIGGDTPNDDLHLPVGEGKIDFNKIFMKLKKMNYNKTITLELKIPEITKCLKQVRGLISNIHP